MILLLPFTLAYPDHPQTYGMKLMRFRNGNQDISKNINIHNNDVLGYSTSYEEPRDIQQVDEQYYDLEDYRNITETQQSAFPSTPITPSLPINASRVVSFKNELNDQGQKCIRRQVMRYVTEYEEEMGCEVTYEPVCHTYKEVPKEICTVKRVNPVRRPKPYVQTFCFKPEEGDFSDGKFLSI